MNDFRRALHALLAEAETRIDGAREALRRTRPGPAEALVQVYGGHGNQSESVVRGRLLEARPLPPATPEDSVWRNLVSTFARLESDEIPGATVRVDAGGGVSIDVETDEEGYFEARFATPPGETMWRSAEATVVAAPPPFGPGAQGMGPYQVPVVGTDFGIISDIDDTILETDATNLVRMIRTTLTRNAHTRRSFQGVSTFYRGLATAPAGHSRPFFYVSSSPWNLFDFLTEFLALNEIPGGTLLLKDYGLTADHLLGPDHVTHKRGHILEVLDLHPELTFVLVGDSGQDDAKVYADIVADRPGRIRAVYLRDVVENRADVREAVARIADAGVPAVLGRDTHAMATSAAETGLIAADVVAALAEPPTPTDGAPAQVVEVEAPEVIGAGDADLDEPTG